MFRKIIVKEEAIVLAQIRSWVLGRKEVVAALLTGSRVNPDPAAVDVLSDYDVEVYVTDLSRYEAGDGWLQPFGRILVCCPFEARVDGGILTRLVLFDDGTRIDFQIIEGAVRKPTREEFDKFTHEFWWDATYVAKSLKREELFSARYMMDRVLRFNYLQRILEWSVGVNHNWQVNPNKHGRWLERYLPAREWELLEDTFTGAGINDNWRAFALLLDLFARHAVFVAKALGFDYPAGLDREVRAYLQAVREL
jgi:aminoglycoside 6-adenylyltransferase